MLVMRFLQQCRIAGAHPFFAALIYLYHRLSGRAVFAHHRAIFAGSGEIRTGGLLRVGMDEVGFVHRYDRTYMNINGRLEFSGPYSIGKGCRFDIATGATVRFGTGCVRPFTTFVIMHGLTVGNECSISWGCQFLDEDFHHLSYEGRKERAPEIVIGDRVWIGCNVTVLKGSRIPDGCVVAAGSVISSVFTQQNCIIGGNPARVIRENISWY